MWGQRPYKLIYEWEQGPIPPKWTIDHTCGEKDCLDHLEAVTRGENLRRRHARERGELPIGHAGPTPPGQPQAAQAEVQSEDVTHDGQDTEVEERRAEVRRLRAKGWSVRRIAAHLHIGYGTVRRDAALPDEPAEKPREHDRFDDPDGHHPHVNSADRLSSPHGAAAVLSADQFAIALFERYDRPAVQPKTVSLEDLRHLLTTFTELRDKRQARCWSPTLYAEDATSRSNAGVASVSALVFDLDRVPPDPERLEHVCWIGHTTYSHTAQAPRWRVVISLARPVPAEQWAEVWRRARAALCPEADPSCKDPCRLYYLPSYPSGVTPQATCHDGPLLDMATLPPLPPEPTPPELRLLPAGVSLRKMGAE
jgi:Fe-S-cluster formation regulator IscX/YfhJ